MQRASLLGAARPNDVLKRARCVPEYRFRTPSRVERDWLREPRPKLLSLSLVDPHDRAGAAALLAHVVPLLLRVGEEVNRDGQLRGIEATGPLQPLLLCGVDDQDEIESAPNPHLLAAKDPL